MPSVTLTRARMHHNHHHHPGISTPHHLAPGGESVRARKQHKRQEAYRAVFLPGRRLGAAPGSSSPRPCGLLGGGTGRCPPSCCRCNDRCRRRRRRTSPCGSATGGVVGGVIGGVIGRGRGCSRDGLRDRGGRPDTRGALWLPREELKEGRGGTMPDLECGCEAGKGGGWEMGGQVGVGSGGGAERSHVARRGWRQWEKASQARGGEGPI